MATTSPVIHIEISESAELKESMGVTYFYKETFVDIDDLKTGEGVDRKYATFENDFWLLDGNYKLIPEEETIHVGVLGNLLSDEYGVFSDYVPHLILFFGVDDEYPISSLIIKFSPATNNYISYGNISFYDADSVLLESVTIHPDDTTFSLDVSSYSLESVHLIDIRAYETNKPYRRERIIDIWLDTIRFAEGDIRNATMIEEINPVSIEMPSNSLDFNIYSSVGDFNIIDPQGFYLLLQQKQKVDVYENIDGSDVFMGRFYLDNWNVISDNEMHFECIDAISLLEKITYHGGFWHTPQAFNIDEIESEDLIDDIMTEAGIEYTFDSNLEGITLEGWLPTGNSREALKQFCFAVGGYATCSRSKTIDIIQADLASNLSIDKTLAFSEVRIESIVLMPLVTSVELFWYRFARTLGLDNSGDGNTDTNLKKLIEDGDILPTGDYFIDLYPDIAFHYDYDPNTTPTATLTNIYNAGAYITFTVTVQGTYALRMIGFYKPSTLPYLTELESFTRENKIVIDSATMITEGNYETIGDWVLSYYQQRHRAKVKLFGTQIYPGECVSLETNVSGKRVLGLIEKIRTNLSGGFISEIEIIGDIDTET